jgi:hypothetical protein
VALFELVAVLVAPVVVELALTLAKVPVLTVTPETCVDEYALVPPPPDPNVPVEPPTPLGE